MTRTKNAVNNIIFGIINKLILILFPFAIKTVIINVLGIQYLALNALFTSILNILNLAELGFGTAMVFSLYKPLAENNAAEVNALLNLYKKIYRTIGLIVLSCGIVILPFLKFFIKGSYPSDINLYLLFLVFLLNNVIGYFFFAYKNSLLVANQRNDLVSKINTLVMILYYTIQIIVLYIFKNYYVYIIFLPISTLLFNLLVAWRAKKLYPQYFCFGEVDTQTKANLKKEVSALILHRIGSVIQSSIDNICISAFIGLTLLGKYNNYFYILSAVEGFLTILRQSITASVGNSLVSENKEHNKSLFYRLTFIFSWIIGWCSTCLLVLYQPFMNIWVKQANMLSFSIVICLVVLFYSNQVGSVVSLFKDALGMWNEDKFRPICISIFNLILTIISAKFNSLEGVILSTVGGYLLISLPWMVNVFYRKYLGEKVFYFYKEMVLYLIVNLVSIISTYYLSLLIPLGGIKEVAIKFILCLFVPNIINLILLCWKKEFKECINILKQTISKKRVK